MATRSKATQEKRRKEMARKEKQRMKAERRQQRKLNPGMGAPIEELAAGDEMVSTEEQPPQENL